jgi:hypothetical protein
MRTKQGRALAFGTAFVAYGLLLGLSIALLGLDTLAESPFRAAVALLPVPAALVLVGVSINAFLASDELEQRTRLIGLAASFLGTAIVVFSWGLLEGVGFERLSGFTVFGVLIALYLAGLGWAQWRYR